MYRAVGWKFRRVRMAVCRRVASCEAGMYALRLCGAGVQGGGRCENVDINSSSSVDSLRFATYNIRVDHCDDVGQIHEWRNRRAIAAASIYSLNLDLVALQEPSRVQAGHLAADLGSGYRVEVQECDPDAWNCSGGAIGQRRDGNGFAWKHEKLVLLEPITSFWLSSTPAVPSASSCWNGSPYLRTCTRARFKEIATGNTIIVYSAHLDHTGHDMLSSGASESRLNSAPLIFERALSDIEEHPKDTVIVAGDFNSFADRAGACYAAVTRTATGKFSDVRDLAHGQKMRQEDERTWFPLPGQREYSAPHRYDQVWVALAKTVTVASSFVSDVRAVSPDSQTARSHMSAQAKSFYAYGSDHRPLVVDFHLGSQK